MSIKGTEIGSIIPIEVLEKALLMAKSHKVTDHDRNIAWFSDRNADQEQEASVSNLAKLLEERKIAQG